jgi:hypothetical protein
MCDTVAYSPRIASLPNAFERGKVTVAVALEDDRGGIGEPDQEQVEDEPPGAPVAVEEGVDLLEARVELGQRFRVDALAGGAERLRFAEPVRDCTEHIP